MVKGFELVEARMLLQIICRDFLVNGVPACVVISSLLSLIKLHTLNLYLHGP